MNTNDLRQIKDIIKDLIKGLATKQDLKNFATKIDLQALKKELKEHISNVEMNIIAVVDKHKADRESVQELERRVIEIEDKLRSRYD